MIWTQPGAYIIARSDGGLTIDEAVGDPEALTALVLGATAWAGGKAILHGDLDLGTPDVRPGGMVRGGTLPPNAWFSVLDHF